MKFLPVDVGSWLRRSLRRELSPEEIDMARKGENFEERCPFSGCLISTEYSVVGGDLQVKVVRSSFKPVTNVSRPHDPHYIPRVEEGSVHRFNENGQVEEIFSQEGSVYGDFGAKFKIVRFSPPGSLFGKRVRESDRDYDFLG